MEVQALRVPEAARVLNMGESTCRAAIKRGEIPSVKIGGLILVPRQAIDDLLRTGAKRPAISGGDE